MLPLPALAQGYEEPAPGSVTVSVGDARGVEGNTGLVHAIISVRLSASRTGSVTVDYTTPVEGTATATVDYDPVTGSVTIPAGATSAEIRVPVRGDTVAEPDESFFVHLASATGAAILKHHGAGTIADDDGGAPGADTTPPNTIIHGGPRAVTRARRASFHLVSTEPYARVQCKLDRGPWRACPASKAYRGLKPGRHVFRARAVDAAGNVDRTPASKRWRIRAG